MILGPMQYAIQWVRWALCLDRSGLGVELTIRLLLMPILKMSEAIPPISHMTMCNKKDNRN